MPDKDFQAPEKPGIKAQVGKGATISGSGTGAALLINWIWKLKFGQDLDPNISIILAGALTFIAGRIWTITDQILEKKFNIDLDV